MPDTRCQKIRDDIRHAYQRPCAIHEADDPFPGEWPTLRKRPKDFLVGFVARGRLPAYREEILRIELEKALQLGNASRVKFLGMIGAGYKQRRSRPAIEARHAPCSFRCRRSRENIRAPHRWRHR